MKSKLEKTTYRVLLLGAAQIFLSQCGDEPVRYEVIDSEDDPATSIVHTPNNENAEVGNSQEKNEEKTTNRGSSSENNGTGENGGGESESKTTTVQRDRFVQLKNDSIDFLWVIDNSGSMRPFQTSLRKSLKSFVASLDNDDMDFQVGITTTDVCPQRSPQNREENLCPGRSSSTHQRGSLVGTRGKRVIHSYDKDVVSRFQKLAKVGTKGSGFEHGLTAALMAVEKSLDGKNDDFLRRDSYLSVVVLSDEDDDGVGLARKDENGKNWWEEGETRYQLTADTFAKKMKQKLGKQRFSLSSIVATPDSSGKPCKLEKGRALEIGREYIKASQLTGGHIESLCGNDWSALLERMAVYIKAQLLEFSLSKQPIKSSIKVFIDGSEAGGWSYENASNKIRFVKNLAPRAGSSVEIVYRLAP